MQMKRGRTQYSRRGQAGRVQCLKQARNTEGEAGRIKAKSRQIKRPACSMPAHDRDVWWAMRRSLSCVMHGMRDARRLWKRSMRVTHGASAMQALRLPCLHQVVLKWCGTPAVICARRWLCLVALLCRRQKGRAAIRRQKKQMPAAMRACVLPRFRALAQHQHQAFAAMPEWRSKASTVGSRPRKALNDSIAGRLPPASRISCR